ncbi:hypothetical protein, partial [Phascolarctobacterium faecium]|uniref:hypothetical protein n=1 Tax=Phascolarctobacterium faecium TaxID=33025 RepID=UPI003AB3DFBD
MLSPIQSFQDYYEYSGYIHYFFSLSQLIYPISSRVKSGGYLLDKILDAAGQKGTGKWSVINA